MDELARVWKIQEPVHHLDIMFFLYEAAVTFIKEQELFSIVEPLVPERLKDHYCFKDRFMKPDKYLYDENSVGDNAQYLRGKYHGLVRTHTKLRFIDPRWVEKMLSEENIHRVYCLIKEDPKVAEKLTCKRNYCAIVTNGSSVLDLADIGGLAALPIVEGKAFLMSD
jgi:hypothetical protein